MLENIPNGQLSALATASFGTIASIIAISAIISNRQLAKKKNSLDTILVIKGDDKLKNAIGAIYKVHKDPTQSIETFAYDENAAKEEAQHIRYVLNFFEYLSVGVDEGVYAERILKNSMYSTVVNIYERCRPFVNIIRSQGQKTAYCNFEKLAVKWENNPIKKPKKS